MAPADSQNGEGKAAGRIGQTGLTRISAVNVDFPLDVVLYARNSHRIIQHRYEKEDLQDLSNVWQEGLRRSINNLSADWVEHAFDKLALPDDNPSRLLPAPNGADRV